MLVSLDWLAEYVDVKMSHDELVDRLTMAGLNHEGTEEIDGDRAIDLEVTSNRPDCLGHIGVAREIAVLFEQELRIPRLAPATGKQSADSFIKIRIDCPDLCSRYTARVIRGVKIGPSPDWLVQRLRTLGVATVNNVVDISNYVLLESGQPLHVFDLKKIEGGEIIVREAVAEEPFEAIDHKTYKLDPGMCVIADTVRPVALGGVMGGADSEVSGSTTDLLIESADFAPLSIRSTARRLNLHSPSSYRFERGVDPEGIDWASCRCCELILEEAGGELAEGMVDIVAQEVPPPSPISLRFAQVPRILGIDIDSQEICQILTALGLNQTAADVSSVTTVAPAWRRDLTREIDLIEEVARVYGYEKIPEDVSVPMAASHRSDRDRVLDILRHGLTAAGFDEVVTASVVDRELSDAFSPWTQVDPLLIQPSMLRGADLLRRSVVPSLLKVRRTNESLSNRVIELFETAHVYFPEEGAKPRREEQVLAISSALDFSGVKGVIESLLESLHIDLPLEISATKQSLLDNVRSCKIHLGGELLGFLGEVSSQGRGLFKLRGDTTLAELRIKVLHDAAHLVPLHTALSDQPSISQDMNFVVAEEVRWTDLQSTVQTAAGPCLERVEYCETYRDPERDGESRKRLLLSVTLRSREKTLTGDEANAIRNAIIDACRQSHDAVLL